MIASTWIILLLVSLFQFNEGLVIPLTNHQFMSPRIELTINFDQESRLDHNAIKVDTFATYRNNHTYIMKALRREKIEDTGIQVTNHTKSKSHNDFNLRIM